MAFQKSDKSGSARPRRAGAGFRSRKKVCGFCGDKVKPVDYKDVGTLRKYISERGKVLPRRITSESNHYRYQACKTHCSVTIPGRLMRTAPRKWGCFFVYLNLKKYFQLSFF